MHEPRNVADAPSRRREAALAGHLGRPDEARDALTDDDGGVRATALAALGRLGQLRATELAAGLRDPSPRTRRSACEVAVRLDPSPPGLADLILPLLADEDPAVAEVAAWALGEVASRHPPAELPDDVSAVVAALARAATDHEDALVRESAVAALGAIGDPAGLPAILAGTTDKPAVRRRAVLALAPFSGPDVAEALARASADRDWQVRDAAELLLRDEPD